MSARRPDDPDEELNVELSRRPHAALTRDDLRWIEGPARRIVANHLRWWGQVNPAWIEQHLDPSSCRRTESSVLPPNVRGVTCCVEHAEVADRMEQIADLLLLYPFVPASERADRYRRFDRLYPELFVAWYDSSPRPGGRRLPLDALALLQEAALAQAAHRPRCPRRAEGLAWIDTLASNLLPRHMAWWHDVSFPTIEQHLADEAQGPGGPPLDPEITDHLDEIGLLLVLATFAGPGRRERIRIWTRLDDQLEHLVPRWISSCSVPSRRRLDPKSLRSFRNTFGRVNDYEFFFE
jgi:hypothetical protein